MLFSRQIGQDNALLAIWKLDETIAEIQSGLSRETLSDSRLSGITNDTRKLEFLSVRRLLKELCREEKQIAYTETGRPYLADNSYYISISHTKGYVAVLLHPAKEVGMDIEQRGERAFRLKERFMHTDEIASLQPGEEALHATLYWSAKESLFKVMGVEEVDFIHHLHIHPFQLTQAGSFTADETRTDLCEKFTIQYQVFPHFVLTWCSR
ncbi:MAG: 4'-phosphopantetheinyl transferase superfamily protein [Paludibacteraceae bacterium]|nr:4'-phosphopantetheinyl transferase superfamily protein [Paludibacteraceae bacterium]